jgi:hypothetical protein
MPDAYKVIDQWPHKWIPNPGGGGHWQPLPHPADEGARNTEALKQGLTLAGGVMGGAALPMAAPYLAETLGLTEAVPALANALRLGGSAIGGAGGRVTGKVVSPRDTSTVADNALIGGGEGLINEVIPQGVGKVAEGLGKAGQWAGSALLDNPNWGPWLRAKIATMRGAAGTYIGGPATGLAASVGPIAATEGGRRLEDWGARQSTAGLAERVTGALDSLLSRIWPAERPLAAPLTAAERAERMSAAAQAAAEGPTGARVGSPDVRVNRTRPFTAAGPYEEWTPPPARPAPRTSTGDPMHVDTRTDFRPDVTVNEKPYTSDRISPEPIPDEAVTYRPRPEGAGLATEPPAQARPAVQGDYTDPQSRMLGLDRPNLTNQGDDPFWFLKDTAVDPAAPYNGPYQGGSRMRPGVRAEWEPGAAASRPGPTIEAERALSKPRTAVDVVKGKAIKPPANLTADELVDYYGSDVAGEPPPAAPPPPTTTPVDALTQRAMDVPHSGSGDPSATFRDMMTSKGALTDEQLAEATWGKIANQEERNAAIDAAKKANASGDYNERVAALQRALKAGIRVPEE